MTRSPGDPLTQKLNELNEQYNQLYASYQLQQESLSKVDQKKQDLQHQLEQAQTKKTELQRKVDRLSADRDAHSKRLHDESKERLRYTTKLHNDLNLDIASNRRTHQMLVMRLNYLKEKWAPMEMDYIRKIRGYDQELLMINAKKYEVAERLKLLSEAPRRMPLAAMAQTGAEFFDIVGAPVEGAKSLLQAPIAYQIPFSEDCEHLQKSVEAKRRELSVLMEECRALQKIRNSILAKRNEGQKEEEPAMGH
jgi:chromosome segregation ATPase